MNSNIIDNHLLDQSTNTDRNLTSGHGHVSDQTTIKEVKCIIILWHITSMIRKVMQFIIFKTPFCKPQQKMFPPGSD